MAKKKPAVLAKTNAQREQENRALREHRDRLDVLSAAKEGVERFTIDAPDAEFANRWARAIVKAAKAIRPYAIDLNGGGDGAERIARSLFRTSQSTRAAAAIAWHLADILKRSRWFVPSLSRALVAIVELARREELRRQEPEQEPTRPSA